MSQHGQGMIVCITVAGFVSVLGISVAGFVSLVRRVSGSVGLAAPTAAQLEEESPAETCPLFRHLPQLAKKLAWRSLGVQGSQTPIHICKLSSGLQKNNCIEFLLKREDLILNDYGGNKIRTLQHQLAVCESRRESGEKAFQELVTIGSGGSNQVVATVVHARKLGWDGKKNHVRACWFDKDQPDLDNTLNMLSVFSFPNVAKTHTWGEFAPLQTLRGLRHAWTQNDFVPMMLGGNCPAGVLGQAGGILELAEQIISGKSPDVTRIYVPVGSACTVSGLVVGVVLSRHLGLDALSSPDFKIIGCHVHDLFALAHRLFGFHVNLIFKFIPLTITHTVIGACRALNELGGPDLEKSALDFIKHHLEIRADKFVVGKYGGHSKKSREVAKHYDENGSVLDYKTGKVRKELWVCGHFVSKALRPLIDDLEMLDNTSSNKFMLWMTKSAVQPRGSVNEWPKLQGQNSAVKKWADSGKAESILRPGRISIRDGTVGDYRSIMTEILN